MGWDTTGEREDGARLVLGYLGAGGLILGGTGREWGARTKVSLLPDLSRSEL